MKNFFFILLFSIFLCGFLFAQNSLTNNEFGENRLYYNSAIYGGFFQHTSGWGGAIRKSNRISAKSKRVYGLDLVSMKHPKQFVLPISGTLRKVTYGKLNSFHILRPTVGKKKVLFTKDVRKGVEISLNSAAGFSLGYSKPIYVLVVRKDAPNSARRAEERYNPDVHSVNTNIIGRGRFLTGVFEGEFYPGLHFKYGIGFEFSPEDKGVKYLETGLSLDAYYKRVPLMAYINNNPYFVTYYLNFFFGKKSL